MLSPPTAYDGLYELSAECWRCLADTVYMASASVPRFPIIGNAPGVFDDIRNFLQNVLNLLSGWTISSWVRNWLLPLAIPYIQANLVNPFNNFITTIHNSILAWWNWGVGYIHNLLSGISSAIKGGLASFRDYVWDRFTSLAGTISNSLRSFREFINDRLSEIRGAIGDSLSSFRDYVYNRLWSLEMSLGGYIDTLRRSLTASIYGAMYLINTPLADITNLKNWFRDTLPQYLSTIGVNAMTQLWNTIVAGLSGLWLHLTSTCAAIVISAQHVGVPLVSGLWAGVSSLPSVYLSWLATTCGTNLALTPSRALASVGTLYGMAITAGTAAMVTATALNIIPTLNWVGAAQLAGLVSEAAGFDALTKATYGVLINDALTIPLRYHWNQVLRPKLPTEGEIFIMGRKHGINQAEFSNAMSYMGLPNWWIEKMYDFFWTDPSPMWLLRMTEGGIPTIKDVGRKGGWLNQWIPNWRSDPLAWLRMKLMLAGYEDIDIQPMIEGMRMRALGPSTTQMKTSARAMLRDAYWTKAQADAYLIPLGVRPEEIQLMAIAEELDYQHEYLDDQVTYYIEAYRKGQLTDQDLSLVLTTIYVKPERVAQVVTRERIHRLPTPKAVTPVEKNPLVTRLRTQAIDSWIKQFRAWEISQEDLLLSLTIIVQDANLARSMVNVEITRFRPTPPAPKPPAEDPLLAAARRQAIATWITAFRDGTIVAAELELYLEPLIVDAALRHQLVQLERLRYSPTPELIALATENEQVAKVRAEYVRGHIEMFQTRLITIEQLYQFLLTDGLVEPLARATVITQATKRIKMPPITSPYYLQEQHAALIDAGLRMYEEWYMAGVITLAQYNAWLTTLAKDQDVVTYLADVLALRKFTKAL